jgi:diguanylate cyclase (GGDEF)-like protein
MMLTRDQGVLATMRGLVSSLLLIIFILLAQANGLLKPIHYILEDVRFSVSPKPATDALVVVQIDPASISRIGPWPWRRGVHAELVEKLLALGAADIALDIDFSSPSQFSEDQELAEVLQRAGDSIILSAFKQASFAADGSNTTFLNLPISSFADHAWVASVNVLGDTDGKIRRIAASESAYGRTIPALAVMLAGHTSGANSISVDYGIDPDTIDRIPVIDVLDGTVTRDRIEGKKVIVGATALELRDYLLVPAHGYIAGPIFHALGADTLLQGRVLHSPSNKLMAGVLALLALAMQLLIFRRGWVWAIAGLTTAALATELAALQLYVSQALLIDTAGIHCYLAGVGIVALLQEINLGKINLWLARTESGNLRAVLGQVVTDNFDGIVVADENGLIEASSVQAAALLNLPAESLRAGQRIQESLPRELSTALTAAVGRFRSGEAARRQPFECVLNAGGSVKILEYLVTPSRLKRREGAWRRRLIDRYVGCLTFRDITEQRLLEQETYRLARYSELTGLPNRNFLHEKLEQMRNGDSSAIAVMVIDIDRFRSINTTLGYDYGDRLLRAVATRLTSLSGEVKFVAHLEGDDFAAVLGDWASNEDLKEVASLLLFAMRQPYAVEMRQLHVSFSAGLYIFPPGEHNSASGVMRADNALLVAKQSGGGALRFYDEATTGALARRQALEIELWSAIEKGQVNVLYQPQVDLFTHQIVGAEALLRWEHPSQGTIPPEEFIPLAEASGLMLPLGRWVLRRACQDATYWPGDCKIAVNLSVRQLIGADLSDEIEEALELSGLSREQLELEITEGVFMSDAPRVMEAMRELQTSGITVALDDFGTGYSSLGYLSSFHFDKLKIDKSFIANLETNNTSRTIVRSIISLARQLDLEVMAEGVENLAQIKILQLLGCRRGQGYFYGRPQTAKEFAETLSRPPLPRIRVASRPSLA